MCKGRRAKDDGYMGSVRASYLMQKVPSLKPGEDWVEQDQFRGVVFKKDTQSISIFGTGNLVSPLGQFVPKEFVRETLTFNQ